MGRHCGLGTSSVLILGWGHFSNAASAFMDAHGSTINISKNKFLICLFLNLSCPQTYGPPSCLLSSGITGHITISSKSLIFSKSLTLIVCDHGDWPVLGLSLKSFSMGKDCQRHLCTMLCSGGWYKQSLRRHSFCDQSPVEYPLQKKTSCHVKIRESRVTQSMGTVARK